LSQKTAEEIAGVGTDRRETVYDASEPIGSQSAQIRILEKLEETAYSNSEMRSTFPRKRTAQGSNGVD
jgi:hypothetical protein